MTALLPYTWHKISWDTPPWPLTPIFEQMCRSIGLILRKPGHRGNRFSKPDSGDAVGNEIQQFSLTRYNTQKNWSGRRDSNSRPQPWQSCIGTIPRYATPRYSTINGMILRFFSYLSTLYRAERKPAFPLWRCSPVVA